MPIKIIIGPANTGKTSRVIEILKSHTPLENESSVRYIVPNLTYALRLRHHVLSNKSFPGFMGDPICTFYQLACSILWNTERKSPPPSDAQRNFLAAEVLRKNNVHAFEKVLDCPNLPSSIIRTIETLKSALIYPDNLNSALDKSANRISSEARERIIGLIEVYRLYQEALNQCNLLEVQDIMEAALRKVESNPDILEPVRHFILDGFQKLSPIQQKFVRMLTEDTDRRITVTLDYQEGRPEVFGRIEETYRFLNQLPEAVVEHVKEKDADKPNKIPRIGDIIFSSKPTQEKIREDYELLVGDNPESEIELVADKICKLIAKDGYQFSDIAVIARRTKPYLQRINSIFCRRKIPIFDEIRYLADSRLADSVMMCFKSFQNDSEKVLLESPHMDTDTAAEMLGELREEINRPGVHTCNKALESLMSRFKWPEEEASLRDDMAARRLLLKIGEEIAECEKLSGHNLNVGEYIGLLENGINSRMYRLAGINPKGISLRDMSEMKGEKFLVIFIINFSDHGFPGSYNEDPLLKDSERLILNEHLPNQISESSDRAGRDRFQFYMTVSAALEKLFLSYSALDSHGRESWPSTYLQEIERLVPGDL